MSIFLDPGRLVDDDLELALVECHPGDPLRGLSPAYFFFMKRAGTPTIMGGISLRIGNDEDLLLYYGHIGYGVDEPYRGHHYAARSSVMLFPLALRHGLDPLWITCNPDNWPSRRACELAGGQLIDIVNIPARVTDLRQRGERQKCRYRFDVRQLIDVRDGDQGL